MVELQVTHQILSWYNLIMAASTAQITTASVINWSTGVPFNGYVVFTVNLPSPYTKVFLKDTSPQLRVPTKIRIPIREGVYDSLSQIWQTSSLVPPTCTYSTVFYDSTDRSIANGAATFTVTSSLYTLNPPTLTAL